MKRLSTSPAPLRRAGPRAGGWSCTCSAILCGCTTELVFMLVLRRFWIHQSIRPITWGAAAVTCVSLTVFVVAGQPGGGQPTPISHRWLTAGLACCAVAAVLAVLARWGSPSQRAAV